MFVAAVSHLPGSPHDIHALELHRPPPYLPTDHGHRSKGRKVRLVHLLALLLLLATLRLGGTTELLRTVLALLALLAGGLLDLGGVADTDQSVVGLELLHGLYRIVDEGETGGLAATVLGAHAEDVDLILVRLVDLGELAA